MPINNQAAEIIDNVIAALMVGGEKAAEVYITALDPGLLAIPIIAWLLDEGIEYLGHIVSVIGQKNATAIVIDIQTSGEESEVVAAGTALVYANASGNKEAIQNAVNDATNAYKKLFTYDGSYTPQ